MGRKQQHCNPTGASGGPSGIPLVLFLALIFTVQTSNAKTLTVNYQIAPAKTTDGSEPGIAALADNTNRTSDPGRFTRVSGQQIATGSYLINEPSLNETAQQSLKSTRFRSGDTSTIVKDITNGDFINDDTEVKSASPYTRNIAASNNRTVDRDLKSSVDLNKAQSEENEVLSLREIGELKPKEKKLRQHQHQLGVHRILEEEEFDFEHYLDKIPIYDDNKKIGQEGHFGDQDFDVLKAGNRRHEIQEALPGVASFGITITPDVSMMKKIFALLGLEDTSVIDHHLREAEKTVDATLAREKQGQNQERDDDLVIVKSVHVNVRKIP